MTETPERTAALAELQTRLLDFVVKQLKAKAADGEIPGLTQPFAETISAQVEAAVKKGVAEVIGAAKAKSVADEILAKLKVDAPHLFTPAGAGKSGSEGDDSLDAALAAARQAGREQQQSQITGDENNDPDAAADAASTTPPGEEPPPKGWFAWAQSNWPAVFIIAILLTGVGLLGYASYVQTQQLGTERAYSSKLSNDVNGACGVVIEIDREIRALEDTAKQCAVAANREQPVCRTLEKLKRWRESARPNCKLPKP